MNDNLPSLELPELAAQDRLADAIDVTRQAISLRVGYEVELAGLEPVLRDGHANIRVHWRRKKLELYVVN